MRNLISLLVIAIFLAPTVQGFEVNKGGEITTDKIEYEMGELVAITLLNTGDDIKLSSLHILGGGYQFYYDLNGSLRAGEKYVITWDQKYQGRLVPTGDYVIWWYNVDARAVIRITLLEGNYLPPGGRARTGISFDHPGEQHHRVSGYIRGDFNTTVVVRLYYQSAYKTLYRDQKKSHDLNIPFTIDPWGTTWLTIEVENKNLPVKLDYHVSVNGEKLYF